MCSSRAFHPNQKNTVVCLVVSWDEARFPSIPVVSFSALSQVAKHPSMSVTPGVRPQTLSVFRAGPRQRDARARAHTLNAATFTYSFICSLFLPPSLPVVAHPSYFHLLFIFPPALPHSLPLLTAFCSLSSLPFVLSQPVEGTTAWEPCWLWTRMHTRYCQMQTSTSFLSASGDGG